MGRSHIARTRRYVGMMMLGNDVHLFETADALRHYRSVCDGDLKRVYWINQVATHREVAEELDRVVSPVRHMAVGTLRYSGDDRLTMEIEQDLADYYRSLIPPWLGFKRGRYGAHVTVVRQGKERPVDMTCWGRYEGQQVPFLYDPIIRFGKIYAWLDVYCTWLEELRLELGLPAQSVFTRPPDGFRKVFHTTLGNSKP